MRGSPALITQPTRRGRQREGGGGEEGRREGAIAMTLPGGSCRNCPFGINSTPPTLLLLLLVVQAVHVGHHHHLLLFPLLLLLLSTKGAYATVRLLSPQSLLPLPNSFLSCSIAQLEV